MHLDYASKPKNSTEANYEWNPQLLPTQYIYFSRLKIFSISEIEIFSSTNLFLNKLENIFWKYLRQKLRYAIIQQFPSLAIYPRFNAKVSRDGIEISPCYSARLFHSSCFISACAKIIQLRVNFPIETSPLLSPPRVQNFKLSPIEIDRTSSSDVGSFSSRKCIYSKVYICLSTDLDDVRILREFQNL